ncbi:MAG: hypothetical protein FD156_2764 [Nitrospirae bacterium]|nr:MAG: hypothetical protein FD156_2764 [Nitrospirota bacterium]
MPEFKNHEEYQKWKAERAKETKENPNRKTMGSATKSHSETTKNVTIAPIKKAVAVIRTLFHNRSEASKQRNAVKKIRQQEQLQKQLQRYKNSNRKMNCPSCHTSISVNAVACPKCGQPITDSIWKKEILRKQNNSNVLAAIVSIPAVLFVCLVIAVIYFKADIKSNPREDISTLPNPKSQSVAVDPRLIIQFEKSEIFQKYEFREKSQWRLNTGGVNFNYVFTDPDSPDKKSVVEMSHDQENVITLSITLKGRSTLQPANLTESREKVLYDVIRSFYPALDFDELFSLIRAKGGLSYDGGSDSMPRKELGTVSVYVGTVGPDLIIGIESQRAAKNRSELNSKTPYYKDTSPAPSSSYSSSEAERTRKE